MKKLLVGITIGSALTFTTSAFADSFKEYILTKIEYPIVVKGKEYANAELPALNYEGNTYVPLKAVGDVLGASVTWNDQLKRVEIGDAAQSSNIGNVSTPNSTVESKPVEQTASNKPEFLKDYIQNAESPALKYQGKVYFPVRAGAEKYNLKVSWDASTKTIKFDGTNTQARIADDITNAVDGFIYQGTTYVRESIFANASKEAITSNEQLKTSLDQSYETFKKVFQVDRKQLTEQNVVFTDMKQLENLDIDTFFKWWNGLAEKRKSYMEAYTKELQQLNPKYKIQSRFFYRGVASYLVGEILADNNGVATNSFIYEIKNPAPDQSSIK